MLSLRCGLNLIRYSGHFQTNIAPICNLSINVTDFFYLIFLIWFLANRSGQNMNCIVKEKKVSHWAFWVISFNFEHSYWITRITNLVYVKILESIHLWIFRLEVEKISIWSYFLKFIVKSPMSKRMKCTWIYIKQ